MWDSYQIDTHFKSPALIAARFVGAGASVPTPIAQVNDAQATKSTLARSGVGLLTFTPKDAPMGVIQCYSFEVASPANNKNVQVTPPTPGSYLFTLAITYHANGVAVDIASSEELVIEIWTARSGTP